MNCTVKSCGYGCATIRDEETCYCPKGYQLKFDHTTCEGTI